MLKTMARDGAKGRTSAPVRTSEGGADPAVTEREWPHVRLLPLSYDQLALTGDDEPEGDEEKSSATNQLWMRLAKSAVSGAHGGGLGPEGDVPEDPLAFAERGLASARTIQSSTRGSSPSSARSSTRSA